ncbi:MAG: response regulator [Kofleriaceae bacterium]|nr:response regulator [Kofleriaceae bacterium]MCL4225316.1 response regulator [Myxococcales bacterium]
MTDDLRARFLPRFVEVAARRVARGLEAVTGPGPGQALVARTELHSLAGEAGILGLVEVAAAAQAGEEESRRWLEAGDDVDARARCAVALRTVSRLLRELAAARAVPTPAPGGERRRVLVVDDSELVASQVCDHLRATGWETMAAADVESTLRLVRELRPHVVLMDVHMPGASLAELCARTREAAGPGRVKICLLSGASEGELTDHASRVGADGFVSKVAGLERVAAQVSQIAAAES